MNRARSFTSLSLLAAAALAAVLFSEEPRPVPAETIPSDPIAQAREMDDLVRSIRQQQIQMARNLDEIEAKLAELEESLRQARIYSSRAGRRPAP